MPYAPAWPEYLAVFVFGGMIGSFLNVVIYRVPAGLSLIHPASRCPHCERPIKPWENIPIISYILLGGKCKGCRRRISFQYPLVEALTGALAMLMLWRFGWSWDLLIYFVFSALMLSQSVIDLQTYRLPDAVNLAGVILAVGLTLAFKRDYWLSMALGGLTGLGLLVLQGVVGWAVVRLMSRRDASIGLGDFKFAAMIGLFLGPGRTVSMYVFAIFLGALVGMALILAGRRRFGQRIPFGPYLAVGGITALLWGEQIWSWYGSFLRP